MKIRPLHVVIGALIVFALLVGTARAQQPPRTLGYLGIGLEYNAAHELKGANVLGFAQKSVLCAYDAARTMARTYARGLVPAGDTLAVSCLHINVPRGAADHGYLQLGSAYGEPIGYLGIAIEFSRRGNALAPIYGAKVLGLVHTARDCVRIGAATIQSSYAAGKVKRPLVIFCMPVPKIGALQIHRRAAV